MTDVMSFAALHDQLMELLPPRTVLSLLHPVRTGVIGVPGGSGNHGADGPGLIDTTWSELLSSSESASAGKTS